MKHTRRIIAGVSALLLPVLLIAATEADTRDGDPQAVTETILSVLLEQSEALSSAKPDGRTLHIDLDSFAEGLEKVGDPAQVYQIERIGDRSFEAVVREDVVVCREEGPERGCRIAGDGLLLSLDSATLDADGLKAVARYETTEARRTGATGLHIAQFELSFIRVGDRWDLEDVDLLMIT